MNDRYQSPLSERYASKEMQYIFSPDMKFKTWRKLWIALAESEMELGLNITQEQVDELKAHANDINYDVAKEREKLVRHDVMSHVYAYGVQCPKAKGIIHLGATSCYVGDNTDIIVMTEALKLVRKKLINVMGRNYDAAVLAAGTCGFGMGATPNAMANMQALTEKYVPSVKAYLLVPIIGSMFADFLNSLTITFFINLF